MTPDDFSPERLHRLYDLALAAGYRSAFFGEEATTQEPYLLWRHDVDLDLEPLREFATAQAGRGVVATYFLMARSRFYNVLSHEARPVIDHLLDLGHQVGLHAHLGLPRAAHVGPDEIEAQVQVELDLVERAHPGRFSRIVSFHNPPAVVMGATFQTFYSTYEPQFAGHIKYLSDSNRRWREGPPEQWLDPRIAPRLSLLLHPVLWAHPGTTAREAALSYVDCVGARLPAWLADDDIHV